MGDQDINRVERLARRICKSVPEGIALEGAELHRLINTDCRLGRVSRAWRQQMRAAAEDIPKAVDLALSSGWLVEEGGRFALTSAGAEVAKRSRVGRHKLRLSW